MTSSACLQGDKLGSYGWLRHDGTSYGRQQLVDQACNLTVTLVKLQDEQSGYGGDWAVRLRADHACVP
jgi:mannosyl-oligosaccharide glucosidase